MGKRPQPNDCPLCGQKSNAIQPISGRGHPWNVGCIADYHGCGLVLFGCNGATRSDVIEDWNSLSGPATESVDETDQTHDAGRRIPGQSEESQ